MILEFQAEKWRSTLSCVLFGLLLTFPAAQAQDIAKPVHGLSAFAALKYPQGFKHFDYVNPKAPKGGILSMIGTGGRITFDSLNGYILKGVPPDGLSALYDGYTLVHDSLMVRAYDEPDAVYGLIAHGAQLLTAGKGVRFFLRKEARFHDGTPLRAADVVTSFNLLKDKGNPLYKVILADSSAHEVDALTVEFRFTGTNTRDLPLIVATLPIFSKAYYAKRAFDSTTLEPPLGSGPYRVEKAEPGRRIIYARVKDYWAADLPVNVGRYNFDRLIYEYYRDRTAEFEAFKAGEFGLREEFTSKVWATQYDIPPVREGRMLRMILEDGSPSGAQGFFLNTRRKKLSDPRLRKAMMLAFDFEWTNRNQFHGLYQRTRSFFENSDLMASKEPTEAELKLLSPHRQALAQAGFDVGTIFGEPFVPPVTDGTGRDRTLLRQASALLDQAGWKVQGGQRVNARGEKLAIEFLTFEPTFERILSPYAANLKLIGIDARIRLVDPAQFEERVKQFDFDVMTQRFVMSTTPGIELRGMFSSQSASMPGSRNLSGVAHPAIDALIENVIAAKSRQELRTATRALDRVLRAGHFWVPHWYKASHHLAFWDEFAWPAVKPRYDRAVIDCWWFDAAKPNPRNRPGATRTAPKPPRLTPVPTAN
jgi:microcin C transport system substrate-binding protein